MALITWVKLAYVVSAYREISETQQGCMQIWSLGFILVLLTFGKIS